MKIKITIEIRHDSTSDFRDTDVKEELNLNTNAPDSELIGSMAQKMAETAVQRGLNDMLKKCSEEEEEVPPPAPKQHTDPSESNTF